MIYSYQYDKETGIVTSLRTGEEPLGGVPENIGLLEYTEPQDILGKVYNTETQQFEEIKE
jgi:hypothetical protein